MIYKTISEIEEMNRQAGRNWFDLERMKSFNCKIETEVIGGRYFITSDRMTVHIPKKYTVRMVVENGHIENLSKFQQFKAKKEASAWLLEYLKTQKEGLTNGN